MDMVCEEKLMRSCFLSVILCFSMCFTGLAFGRTEDSYLNRARELRFYMVDKEFRVENKWSFARQGEQSPERRIPAVGILLSTAVPGAGEFYANSWLKGAVFLGAEVVLWVGYWKFSDNGEKWEDIFHDFADTHWSEEEWRDWMNQHPEFSDTTHTLPSTKTQQYYEMIGKYDQFKAGWDDYTEGGQALTSRREHYEELRHKSNVQFKRAGYCTMLALANRVLSVFDTAWTIRRINRKVEGRMRMGMNKGGRESAVFLTLRINW